MEMLSLTNVQPLRVALADDDPQMRALVARLLRSRGAHVVEADDGGGLRHLLTAGHPFDLVVTDFRMPRWSGASVLHEARARGDMTPAILASGESASARAAIRGLARVTVIAKPFSFAEFDLAITRAVPRPRTAETRDAHASH